MSKRQSALAVFGLLLCAAFSPAASHPAQIAQPSYESLLDRVLKSDPAADFTALRLAYFDRPPAGAGDADPGSTRSMFQALREKKYGKALEHAEKIIRGKFVDINAHLVAAAAHKEQGDAAKEKFHRYVAEGLIKSILSSGDGKSEATAYTVISTDEEYVILRAYGLMPGEQSYHSVDGHHYDRLTAVNPKTNEKVTLYFNIDRPFGRLQNIFK